MKKQIALVAVGLGLINPVIAADSTTNPPAEFPVTITVDAEKSLGELKPL